MNSRPLPDSHVGGMRVMSRYCATCVFTSRSGIRPGPLFDALRREWDAHDTHQLCTHTVDGVAQADEQEAAVTSPEGIVCHGFFREVFIPTGLGRALRIAARECGFEYVDPPA